MVTAIFETHVGNLWRPLDIVLFKYEILIKENEAWRHRRCNKKVQESFPGPTEFWCKNHVSYCVFGYFCSWKIWKNVHRGVDDKVFWGKVLLLWIRCQSGAQRFARKGLKMVLNRPRISLQLALWLYALSGSIWGCKPFVLTVGRSLVETYCRPSLINWWALIVAP